VSSFEGLLHTSLRWFVHRSNTQRRILRKTGSHFLPAAVSSVVKHITHLADVPLKRKGKRLPQPTKGGRKPGVFSTL
jgi:hypothetical protein